MKNKYILIGVWSLLLFTAGLAEAQTKVKSSYSGTAGFNIPLWIALETGEFRKLDLEVETVLITGGSRSLMSLLAGDLDFAHASGGFPLQANLRGADVVIVGTISNTMSAGLVVRKEIQSIRDLKGKKLGIPSFGGLVEAGAVFALRKSGLDPHKDVTLIQTGSETARLAALQKGLTEATIISPPGLFVAETMGFRNLANLSDLGMRYPELSIAARRGDLKTRRGMVERYLRAHLNAIRTFKTNKAATLDIIRKYMMKTSSKTDLEQTYDYYVKRVTDSLRTDLEGLREILISTDATIPGAGKRNPADFVDESVLEEALRR
jgi:ABC-type nitrate/sulfonate/bicarbonate transport system substrate-binding protein